MREESRFQILICRTVRLARGKQTNKQKPSPKSLWAFPVSKLSELLNQKKNKKPNQKYKLSNPSAQKGQVYQISSIYYCLDRRCTKGKEMDFSLSNQHMYRLRIYCPNSCGFILFLHIKWQTCFAELVWVLTLIQKNPCWEYGKTEGPHPGSAWSIGQRCPKRKCASITWKWDSNPFLYL